MSKLLSLVLGVCKFFNTNAKKRAENKPKNRGWYFFTIMCFGLTLYCFIAGVVYGIIMLLATCFIFYMERGYKQISSTE